VDCPKDSCFINAVILVSLVLRLVVEIKLSSVVVSIDVSQDDLASSSREEDPDPDDEAEEANDFSNIIFGSLVLVLVW
jgi:hypothetical protein